MTRVVGAHTVDYGKCKNHVQPLNLLWGGVNSVCTCSMWHASASEIKFSSRFDVTELLKVLLNY